MEDKTFDLLEKMYVDILGKFETFDSKLEVMDRKFDSKLEAMDNKIEAMDRKIEVMDKKFESKFDAVDKRFDVIENDINLIKEDVRKINTTIEQEVMPRITVLFDGYKQHSDQLDRIEKEVSRHEEIILRRVR